MIQALIFMFVLIFSLLFCFYFGYKIIADIKRMAAEYREIMEKRKGEGNDG